MSQQSLAKSDQCSAMCPWGWSIKALFRGHLHDLREIYINPIFGQTRSHKVSCTTESKPKLTWALDQLFFFPSYQSICLPKVLYVVGLFIFLFIKAVHFFKVLYALVHCVSQYICCYMLLYVVICWLSYKAQISPVIFLTRQYLWFQSLISRPPAHSQPYWNQNQEEHDNPTCLILYL